MSIFSRLNDIINSNINALLDKAEDPEKMVAQMIREMEDTLVEVRTSLARAIADNRELSRTRVRMQQEARDWERKAEVALTRSREDLARGALQEKQRALREIPGIDQEISQTAGAIKKLSADVSVLQEKISDAKARQNALIARGKTVATRLGMRRRLDRSRVDETLHRFAHYEKRLDDLEGDVETYDVARKGLSEKIADLETEEQVKSDLASLKDRLGRADNAPADVGAVDRKAQR